MLRPMPKWFVYILRSVEKPFIYVGFTNDVSRRLTEHNSGFVKSTKAYKPFQLVAYVAVQTEGKARELEKYFKTGSGKAILKKRIMTGQALTRSEVGLTDEAPKGA